jgi:hypothetical protein
MPRFTDVVLIRRNTRENRGVFSGSATSIRSRRIIIMTNSTTRNEGTRNEGEGNKTADRNYREATRNFVESERGKDEIQKAGDVSAAKEKEIRAAEEAAKGRAKEHDPEEVRTPKKPS